MAGDLGCCTGFSAIGGGPWDYRVLESTSGEWSDTIDDNHIYISYMEAAGWLSGVDLWEIMEFGIAGRSYRILGCCICQGGALPGGFEYRLLVCR